jgi:hypothetical protein
MPSSGSTQVRSWALRLAFWRWSSHTGSRARRASHRIGSALCYMSNLRRIMLQMCTLQLVMIPKWVELLLAHFSERGLKWDDL